MQSPAPCPTPIGCPNPEPCSEVLDAQCVVYTGENLLCDTDVVVTQNDTVAEAIENIVSYICNNQPVSPAYKVYTALLTQSGTDDPIAVVLENTIGNIVWTRDNSGVYTGRLNSAFTTDKTALFIQKDVSLCKVLIVPKDNSIIRIDSDTIQIYTYDDSFLIDSVLNKTSIEIRVYN